MPHQLIALTRVTTKYPANSLVREDVLAQAAFLGGDIVVADRFRAGTLPWPDSGLSPQQTGKFGPCRAGCAWSRVRPLAGCR